jgi:plastocyanin
MVRILQGADNTMTHSEFAGMSPAKILAAVGVVSVIAGTLTGYGLGVTAQYQAPQTREIWLFNGSLPFDSAKFGNIPHDTFTPDRMIVNRGDTLVIHYFNIEDMPDHHTFTMGNPYFFKYVVTKNATNIVVSQATNVQNVDLTPGQNATITFRANLPGIFRYWCVYHLPTMAGYINVIG